MKLDEELANESMGIAFNDMSLNDFETDNEGQLVFYTGVYRWEDGSLHDCPENVEEKKEEQS